MESTCSQVTALAVDTHLLVADEEAFETDKLLVVFLDARGNVVRKGRVEVEEFVNIRIDRYDTRVHEQKYWLGWELGEKYCFDGEIGREMYGIEAR